MDERECCERECLRDCKDKCFDDCFCEKEGGFNIIWIIIIVFLLFNNNRDGCGRGGLFGGLF